MASLSDGPGPVAAQDSFDRRDYVSKVERFSDVVHGSGLHRFSN